MRPQAFASYLLIAWVSTNVLFVGAATILSNSTWETCALTESEMAVNAIKSQAVQGDKALVMADLIQTAVTVLQRGDALYPFNGLQGFPENYPMLITGDAQVRAGAGSTGRLCGTGVKPPPLLLLLPCTQSCAVGDADARCPALPPHAPSLATLPHPSLCRSVQRCARRARDGAGQRDGAVWQHRLVHAQVLRLAAAGHGRQLERDAGGVWPPVDAHALQHHKRLRLAHRVHHQLWLHLLPANHVHHPVRHRHLPGGWWDDNKGVGLRRGLPDS